MKRKRLVLLPFALCFCSACSSSYSASTEMKTFFDGISASSAFSSIDSAKVTIEYKSYDGEGTLLGDKNGGYEFYKANDDYYLHEKYAYTGDQIVDGVETYEYLATMSSTDNLFYIWELTNGDTASIKKTSTLAGNIQTLIQEKVYINTGSYNTGGLYYGDIFMVNSNIFPNDAFVIDNDEKTMSFVYKYAKEFTNESDQKDYIQIDENTCMNDKGLVLYSKEEISFANSKEKGTSDMKMSYNVDLDRVSFK